MSASVLQESGGDNLAARLNEEGAAFYQHNYRNPHATTDLIVPCLVICNTPLKEREDNIRVNAARDLPWLNMQPAHDRKMVLCGGGPSLEDYIEDIRSLQQQGATILSMNGSSQHLRRHGIMADAQCIVDAKEETVSLYDHQADMHYIASQCHPSMFEQGGNVQLWHLSLTEDMENLFPPERVKQGGYAIVGGITSVGHASLCLAYVLGYRDIELYGYDSSYRDNNSHAYRQPLNEFMPTMEVAWAGKVYRTAFAMRVQAERVPYTLRELIKEGCKVAVHGDGLLPAIWNTDASQLTERDKYRLMWGSEVYREHCPALLWMVDILQSLKPKGMVIDFGCGTGRASIELAKVGCEPYLIDFAGNCRDEAAMQLPFLEWDLAEPMPVSAEYGVCCDVMEHIPPEQVETVVQNILNSARNVFFSISTIHDQGGKLIGEELHLTVQPHEWWVEMLSRHGTIEKEWNLEGASSFVVKRKEH